MKNGVKTPLKINPVNPLYGIYKENPAEEAPVLFAVELRLVDKNKMLGIYM